MLAELADRVRRGSLDPVDLVREAQQRIESTNPQLNAVVATRFDEALEDAAASPRTGLLAGLPVLVKDLCRCKGMPTTMGSRLFADAPPDTEDDIAVARLRAEGAIVVGRTNTPAFGASSTTTNLVFGTTVNPWNPLKCPGGSSGGSAAALAAGLAPLATGSDGGGSVRIPASCCGLVGYKPTMGAIGRSHVPSWMGFAAVGTMGTSVADAALEASVLFGPAAGDILSVPHTPSLLTQQLPEEILVTPSFRGYLDPRFATALDDLADQLSVAGRSVRRVGSPFDTSTAKAWLQISAADLAESLRWCRDRWDTFEASTRTHLEYGETVTIADYVGGQRKRYADAARLDELLGSSRVLLVPTINVQSWPADGPFPTKAPGAPDDPFIGLNTPELNFTTHPAVSVPLGVDDAGVPFGVQVVGPRFGDGLALAVSALIEQLRPWPLAATGFDPFASAF